MLTIKVRLSTLTATTDNAETTTAVEATTTVNQQTSAADSGSTTVADETTTVTDAQTQTGRSILYCQRYVDYWNRFSK